MKDHGAHFFSPIPPADSDKKVEDLPKDEQEAIQKKKEALDKFFGEYERAKYKIELHFGKGRSGKSSFAGSLHVYRSGSVLAGGGDEILYPCPGERCPGYMEPEHVTPGFAFCPVCKRKWDKIKDMNEGRLFRLTAQKWAEVVARVFDHLHRNADIYLKSHPADIRQASLVEQLRERRGDEYNKVHAQRVYVMYSLDRIMKDLHAGADLEKRLLAFVTA
jgi:hypothetical protein